MISSKYINLFIIGALIVAVILTGVITFFPNSIDIKAQSSKPEYVNKLFDKDSVISIDIKANKSDWEKMLENATQEEYISCDVTINGTTFKSVGIRPKGNSSLSMVAGSDSDRFSFKFEFDHYIEGQTCFGLDKMVINNVQADATYMKDYLSYDLMSFMGVATPLYSYTNVTVNGENWGFYIAAESLEESFAQRIYGSDYGKLYKPESMGMRGNGVMKDFIEKNKNGDTAQTKKNTADTKADAYATTKSNASDTSASSPTKQNENTTNAVPPVIPSTGDTNNEVQGKTESTTSNNAKSRVPDNLKGDMKNGFAGGAPGGGFGGSSGGGSDLKYTDDSLSSYSNIFDNEVFEGTESDYKRVIKAIKNLNNGTELEKYINVDQTLRYFAANTVLVNLDSYFSSMKHNYYLYEKDGQLTMLPWDYNLAFGGFQSGSASSAVNFPIDTPVSGVEMSERPILSKLLEVDEYKEKYHEYLQQIIDGYFNNGTFETTITKVDKLISEYVKNDTSAFYTYDQYSKAVPMLKEFGKLRAQSIKGQLDGTIPSTTDGQSKASDKLIDASSINLSTMGTQGGGGDNAGGRGKGGGMFQPNANTSNTQQKSDSQSSRISQQGGMQPPDGTQQQGGIQPPDGTQQQGGRQLPDNMPDREVMMKAMQIIQAANGSDLTEDQLAQLKDLGLTDDQISSIQNMSSQFGGKGGMQPGGGMPGQPGAWTSNNQQSPNNSLSSTNIIVLAVSVVFLLAGLLFVIKFRRKKY